MNILYSSLGIKLYRILNIGYDNFKFDYRLEDDIGIISIF